MNAVIILLALVIFSFFARWIFYLMFGNLIMSFTLWKSRGKVSKYDRSAIASVLTRKIPYYKALRPRGKEKFINRVLNHYTHKEFVGKEGQAINREVKTLISAGTTQLTYGLEYSFLKHFNTYMVFPRDFQISKQHPPMYGATFPAGSIWFSWSQIESGYHDYADGVNLAIHEFAHALYLQHRKGIS